MEWMTENVVRHKPFANDMRGHLQCFHWASASSLWENSYQGILFHCELKMYENSTSSVPDLSSFATGSFQPTLYSSAFVEATLPGHRGDCFSPCTALGKFFLQTVIECLLEPGMVLPAKNTRIHKTAPSPSTEHPRLGEMAQNLFGALHYVNIGVAFLFSPKRGKNFCPRWMESSESQCRSSFLFYR